VQETHFAPLFMSILTAKLGYLSAVNSHTVIDLELGKERPLNLARAEGGSDGWASDLTWPLLWRTSCGALHSSYESPGWREDVGTLRWRREVELLCWREGAGPPHRREGITLRKPHRQRIGDRRGDLGGDVGRHGIREGTSGEGMGTAQGREVDRGRHRGIEWR
jgi:hypothetical protein